MGRKGGWGGGGREDGSIPQVLRYLDFYFAFLRVLLSPVWGLATGWTGRLRHGERIPFSLGEQLAGEEFKGAR